MKNLIISVLLMQVITGLPFWVFSNNDRLNVGVALIILFFVLIEALDEVIMNLRRKRRMQKRRARQCGLVVEDLTKKVI